MLGEIAATQSTVTLKKGWKRPRQTQRDHGPSASGSGSQRCKTSQMVHQPYWRQGTAVNTFIDCSSDPGPPLEWPSRADLLRMPRLNSSVWKTAVGRRLRLRKMAYLFVPSRAFSPAGTAPRTAPRDATCSACILRVLLPSNQW